MNLHQKITLARHKMGLTQEEVATLANVTVRTIQRIESGESVPRKFTLKLIASALNIPFEELNVPESSGQTSVLNPVSKNDQAYFLKLLCLSCFTYLLIPYVHFLIPSYILKKRDEQDAETVRFARNVIQQQILWVVVTVAVFLTALGYNFVQAAYLNKQYPANYLLIFFVMYFLNALMILNSYFKINRVFKSE